MKSDTRNNNRSEEESEFKSLSPYLSPYPFIASTRAILGPKGCNVDIGKGFASKLVHGLSFSVQKGFLSH